MDFFEYLDKKINFRAKIRIKIFIFLKWFTKIIYDKGNINNFVVFTSVTDFNGLFSANLHYNRLKSMGDWCGITEFNQVFLWRTKNELLM